METRSLGNLVSATWLLLLALDTRTIFHTRTPPPIVETIVNPRFVTVVTTIIIVTVTDVATVLVITLAMMQSYQQSRFHRAVLLRAPDRPLSRGVPPEDRDAAAVVSGHSAYARTVHASRAREPVPTDRKKIGCLLSRWQNVERTHKQRTSHGSRDEFANPR